MAITVRRSHENESSSGRTLNITYRVTTDDAVLGIGAAIAAAVAAAEIDYGVEAVDASHNRVTAKIIDVPVQLSMVQYYDYLAWPGGGGPYVPTITSDRTARILPPQPLELEQAYAIRQKQFSGVEDNLMLNQDYLGQKLLSPGPVAIYPPQENYSETINVPASLLTPDLFFSLAKMAHKLNQSPMMLGGVAWPAETVMLIAGAMTANPNGGGQLALSFAVGEAYSKTWTRTGKYAGGGTGTTSETMTGIKPFSRLTFDRAVFEPTEDAPPKQNLNALFEHRVWPLSDLYTSVFGAPPP